MDGITVWFLLVFLPNLNTPLALSLFVGVFGGVATVIGIFYVKDLKKCLLDNCEGLSKRQALEYKEKIDNQDRLEVKLIGHIKWYVIGSIVSSLLLAGLPDRKEVAAIVLIPYVSNNSEFKKIPENLAAKLNEYLTPEKVTEALQEK